MENFEIEPVRRTHYGAFWKVLGGAAAVLVVAGIIASFNDIRRYIKISRM